ncbi:MAG TPA: hypothetical protein VEG68_14650 [Terriglobales bacterium]|nr:hypothetical protein [Terriglobales bacterium]
MAQDEFIDVNIDFGPEQQPISEARIREMVTWKPRRMKLATEWKNALHAPLGSGQNWSLVLPFPETFRNSFQAMCSGINHYAHVGKDNRCVIFLNDSQWDEECVEKAKEWIEAIGKRVAIRDCLAISFALDYRMEGGDPSKSKTVVGDLCRKAKPYGEDTKYDRDAARQLARVCVDFLEKVGCYDSADCVAAMPPSRPNKPFDLPSYLARKVASACGKADLREAIKTKRPRGQLKATSVDEKLNQLRGTIAIEGNAFKGKNVLVLDDLYQSGTSVNYLGMLLLEAGAKRILSLACEKTVGNFDNLGSRGGR